MVVGIAMIVLTSNARHPVSSRTVSQGQDPEHEKFSQSRTLPEVDCSQEQSLASPGSEVGASIVLVNQLSEPIRIYRIDTTGKREHIGVLLPRYSSEYHGNLNDVWLVANEANDCLSIFISIEHTA